MDVDRKRPVAGRPWTPTVTRKLRITRREACLEALHCAAALLKHYRFTSFEGERLNEDDELTEDAYRKVNDERERIVASLAKRAGKRVVDLVWEE